VKITNAFQAKYVANVLARGGSGLDRLSILLLDAKVDLNPHQVYAALEVLNNPFAHGHIFADEVGLGKTIETGIVIAEKWAEGCRNIIIVTPAILTKQWAVELDEKFYLPVQELGNDKDDHEAIKICSYNYCAAHEKELRAVPWDLVVMDEAHYLRNLYTGDNTIATAVINTFKDAFTILCTATPLQNSLLDLYSLASVADANLFGSLDSFKANYIQRDGSKDLAGRLQTICTRTLRRQVLEYIRYTDRYSLTQEFELTGNEKQEVVEINNSKMPTLQKIIKLRQVGKESKLAALDRALDIAFDRLWKIGANEQAVIFTEYLPSQDYIVKHLGDKYGAESVFAISGETKKRQDVIDKFKASGKILVSTEVGGAGLNLQFCSLVINYDLPWNPQVIEQRIGRCHRYGQKHDVCVVNLLNKDSAVDARLYELLSEKLKLFNGVFGASDTVLGVLEDTNFEQRISEIYEHCRTEEQINRAFAELQSKLEQSIKSRQENAKQKVFQYLDVDVANKFKGIGQELKLAMSRKEALLWGLAKYALGSACIDGQHTIVLSNGKYNGRRFDGLIYKMDKDASPTERFRLGCPLAKEMLFACSQAADTTSAVIEVSDEKYYGEQVTIALYKLRKAGAYFDSDIMLVGRTASGEVLSEKECERIMMLGGNVKSRSHAELDDDGSLIRNHEALPEKEITAMDALFDKSLQDYEVTRHAKNEKYFEQSVRGLNGWAADKVAVVEKHLAAEQAKINAQKAAAKTERNFDKKIALLRNIKAAESEFADKHIATIKEIDAINAERDAMIATQRTKLDEHFTGMRDFVVKYLF
jgi:superfamily II DNA or RNA helicase